METGRTGIALRTVLETLSACRHLYAVTVRRQLLSRQTIVGAALTLLCTLIVIAWSLHREPTTKRLAQQVLVPTYVAFLMPILSICYGASGVGGEREDRTLIYLLITSIPRPLVYLVKFLATQTLVLAWTIGTLWLLCSLAGSAGDEAWDIFLIPCLLGGLAYASLFLLVGAVFRHGTIISLAYWFFLEVLFGNMPGIIKRISVAFYVRSMIYEAGEHLEIGPMGRVAREMFLPVTAETAQLVLLAGTAALLAVGVATFTRREYRDLS
jgi:ABC-type transport system involved in multi-copper enzyme maturation permease subunit